METTIRRPPDGENGEGSLEITGHLGEVMKESAKIAMTVARNFVTDDPNATKFLLSNHLHLHVPEVNLIA